MVQSATVSVSVAGYPTTLSIEVVPGSGPPFAQQIAGYLRDNTGKGVPGKTISLWVNGAFKLSATTLTDGSYGWYNYVVGVGTYSFDTTFAGDATYLSSVASKSCTFAKVQAGITIAVAPASGEAPLVVTVSGVLTRNDTGDGLAARTVKVYRVDPNAVSTLLGSATTSSEIVNRGAYSYSNTIPTFGTWGFYTVYDGDAQFLGCEVGDGATVTGEGVEPPSGVGWLFLGILLLGDGKKK